VSFRVLKKQGVYFLFSTRFPVEKRRKKEAKLFLGRRLLGAIWNALARDHVLVLGARQQTK